MHEVSIAQSLLKIAVENCEKNGYKRIEAIKVKVGRASGIMPDALLFAFDAVKIGSIADKASLNIEEIPVSGFVKVVTKISLLMKRLLSIARYAETSLYEWKQEENYI